MVDFTLTPDQQDLVDRARAVARRRLAPRAAGYDRSGDYPAENMADLLDSGLLGLLVPVELGGCGADLVTYALCVAELAEACGSTALVFAMHCGATRMLAADDATGRPALAEIHSGRKVIAFGFSEPGTGGNILSPMLPATPVAGGFELIGTKVFCTGAGHTDFFLINSRSGEADFRHAQSMFLLPAETPGIKVDHTWDALGMRANCANTVHFEATVPAGACVGGPGGGMTLLGAGLPPLVLGLAATSLGVARAANAVATGHVLERVHANTGANLAAYQGVRFQVADMAVTLHTAYLSLLHAAVVAESDPLEALPALNLAKYVCNSGAVTVADVAMQLCGGQGFLRSMPVERHYRDARAGAVMGANLGVLRDMIGKAVLGMDPRG